MLYISIGVKKLNEFALSSAHRGQLLGCFARALTGDDDRCPSTMVSDVPTPILIEGGIPFHSKCHHTTFSHS